MEERRRYKRYSVDVMEISGKMVLARHVKILDISLGGVSFKADRRLNIGSEYSLKIEGKGKELSVKGIVVRSLLSESVKDSRGNVIPIYTAGMKFTEVSKDDLHEIAVFIEGHVTDVDKKVDLFSTSGRRLYVRVCIENLETSTLKCFESYRVKNLSLGGMLIESGYALEIESILSLELFIAQDRSLKFSGRVVSCNQVRDKEAEHYDMGLEFLDVSEEDREILNQFIGSFNNQDISS